MHIKMFSRFATALYNAVDALAPPLPLQDDFQWHWTAVTKFYTGKTSSNKISVELTTIPGHLKEMLSIVEQEEKEVEDGNIGPCMEYIMQHKLLDTMHVLAISDIPAGMKQQMLSFITKLLQIVQHSLIPHVSIYIPVQNFIKLCGEIIAGPTENEEMEFLHSVCDKMKENPCLVNCFLSTPQSVSKGNLLLDASLNMQDKIVGVNKDCPLISSLLKLLRSPDNEISLKAAGCLKICCMCADDDTASTIVQGTLFTQTLCDSLAMLYKNIPKTMKQEDLENSDVFSADVDSDKQISSDKRKLLCYLQQLNFIDVIISTAHPHIGDSLCDSFKTEFLDIHLYPDLVESESNDDLLFVTVLTSATLRCVLSTKLVSVFGTFLLGDDDNFDFFDHPAYIVKDTLIERCRCSNNKLALANLQLFEELLRRPTQHILYNLAIKYVENRSYYDHTTADSWLQLLDDDTDSRDSDGSLCDSVSNKKSVSTLHMQRILNCFLSVLPDEVKSCESDDESGYETYLKEAHMRFIKCLKLCENFEWPRDFSDKDSHLGAEDDSSSESQPEVDSARWRFYEGAFLSMLFDKLEHMLHQPYEINLQVTSLISQLGLFAHPYLHEYLLNPLISYTRGARSLFLILFKLSDDIQKEVPNIRGFMTKIKLTRNALLSDGNEYCTFEESNVLEALIVLEEFCKELAAIACVKYHSVL